MRGLPGGAADIPLYILSGRVLVDIERLDPSSIIAPRAWRLSPEAFSPEESPCRLSRPPIRLINTINIIYLILSRPTRKRCGVAA
jgi:hypothetical protein